MDYPPLPPPLTPSPPHPPSLSLRAFCVLLALSLLRARGFNAAVALSPVLRNSAAVAWRRPPPPPPGGTATVGHTAAQKDHLHSSILEGPERPARTMELHSPRAQRRRQRFHLWMKRPDPLNEDISSSAGGRVFWFPEVLDVLHLRGSHGRLNTGIHK